MAKKVTVKVNTSSLEKYFKDLPIAVQRSAAQKIGQTVKDKMLSMVSKGISPIEGNGRFPAYKAVAEVQENKKAITKLRKQKKSVLSIGRRGKLTSEIIKRSFRNIDIKEGTGKARFGHYPYNQPSELGKKARPVNLYLYGQMLSSLIPKPAVRVAKGFMVEIGFFNKQAVDKELGHREGINGQPERPMIPQGDEKLNRSILVEIIKIMRQSLRDYIARKK